jgi:hypothetical protein
MTIILKCSNCGIDRPMTDTSAYEAQRLGKTLCHKCARKLGKPKISKYASFIKVGDVFGNWKVVGDFLGNGTWIECSCLCGTLKKIRAYKLLDGTQPKQCKTCSTGNKSSNWKGVGELPMSVFTKIKLRAQSRNKTFTITAEYIAELYKKQNGKCALSGLPISFTEDGKNLADSKSIVASLDRIDSSLGYVEGNVQWVHKHINSMKNAHTTQYFIQLCKEVVKYNDTNRT